MENRDDLAIGFERCAGREHDDGDGANADERQDRISKRGQHARHSGQFALPAPVCIEACARAPRR